MAKQRSACQQQPVSRQRQPAVTSNQSSQSSRGFVYYCSAHGQAFFYSAGRLWRNPLANFMTIMVLGLALALPAGLYILLKNVQAVNVGWDSGTQVSLFLKRDLPSDQLRVLLQQLQQNRDIARIAYVSPSSGLKQFEQQSGFGNVLQQLHTNPLPGVIMVSPAVSAQSPVALKQLVLRLKQLPAVDVVQSDVAWIKRLYTIVHLAGRSVWALAMLFALAVVLIIGNTLRLAIQHSCQEIKVTRLVGASNAFVRRPFLYIGVIYGFFSALIAYILVNLLLIWLSGPVSKLTGLYQSHFHLQGFGLFATEILFLSGMILGFLGAWLAVGRQLRCIEPE